MDNQKTFSVEPTTQIVKTLSYSGYTLKSALADIIDNSISGAATEIELYFDCRDEWNRFVKYLQRISKKDGEKVG